MCLKKIKTFKMSNWKFRIYVNRKTKNKKKLGREVHPEMIRRAGVHW